MYTSPNMLLEVWDLKDDDFDYTVLANNLALIDAHDHSPERGRQINGGTGIAAGTITQTQMAPLSIGEPQLQANSVGHGELQNNSVGANNLQAGSVGPGAIANGAITAALLDPTLIPLGFVTTWWRPPNTATLPGGFWEIMDGRPWSSIPNAWNLTQGAIPDMRGSFAQGADALTAHGPAIGATGGTTTLNLNHTHQTPAHSHPIPAHNHALTVDGGHSHSYQGGYQMWMRTNSYAMGTTLVGAYGFTHYNGYYSTYIKNLGVTGSAWEQESDVQEGIIGKQHPINDGQITMDLAGAHSHGGGTQYANLTTNNSAIGTTDVGTLGNVPNLPPYTGLLYIMRCR